MYTHELTIKGDSNDGDDVIQTTQFEMHSTVLAQGAIYPNSHPIDLRTLMIALAQAVKDQTKNDKHAHTWSRPDYDGLSTAYGTVNRTLRLLFGTAAIDNLDDYQSEFALHALYDELMELLPYGEIGIHSITGISITPIINKEILL